MQCELHGSVSSEVLLLAEPNEVDVPVDAVPDVDVDEVALLQTTLFPLTTYLL